MAAPLPIIKKLPLKADQYYQGIYKKTHIFLHHTAGGSAASSIAGWAATKEHIATPYVVDRDGTIYECFDPKYWAYSLGVKGGTSLEKASIPIEIASYGPLKMAENTVPGKYQKGDWLTYTDRKIDAKAIVKLDIPHRPGGVFKGTAWEAYTKEQITSLEQLLRYLIGRFNIKLQSDLTKFWEYRIPSKLPPGIWSHTTVRKDKFDIFPQPGLIKMIYDL